MRYPMRLDPVWRPLLALLGGTTARSNVQVTPEAVRFRFGWLFDQTVPRSAIARATRVTWPWYWGIGWRVGPLNRVGLIGSTRGVVEVRLREPHRVGVTFLPWRVRRIAVSVREPDALVAAPGGQTRDRGVRRLCPGHNHPGLCGTGVSVPAAARTYRIAL